MASSSRSCWHHATIFAPIILSALSLPVHSVNAQTPAPRVAVATATVSDLLNAATAQLPALLNDTVDLDAYFSAAFLAAVPETQIRAITGQLRRNYGAAQQISGQELAPGERAALVRIAYASATVHIRLVIDSDGKVAGLRIVDVTANDDSFDRLSQDLAALPGTVAWGIYRIESTGPPTMLHGANPDRDMAVASTFKLVILGALDAEVAARRMAWTDIVRIDRRSPPYSQINDWPDGAPVTLHTLASLMISRSDNAATDILLHHLGRERVENFARRHGGLSGPLAYPLLSTLEATVLKTHADADVTARWIAANETERRRVLRAIAPQWTPADVQMGRFADGPAEIETIEWFASPAAVAAIMSWFDRSASETARAIMAINSGISETAAQSWAYVGYKGGSEPGVMSMNLLLRGAGTANPVSYVVTISWNNPAAPVDEALLPPLLARAAALLLPR